MDVFQLHRTFPQGSNYWGTNLSQVEMTFMWIIKKKNKKIMEDFRCIFMKYASETYARSKEDTNSKIFSVAFIHPKNAFAD